MKQLQLHNESFIQLEHNFKSWLQNLGYGSSSVQNLPSHIKEFLYYLETKQQLTSIHKLSAEHAEKYYEVLQYRRNHKKNGGALSNAYLNKHQQAIKLFYDFLRKAGGMTLSVPQIEGEEIQKFTATALTKDEIAELFHAVQTQKLLPRQERIRARDKAILAIYYCCGLRRTEGQQLNIEDINIEQRRLIVRKGKGYKERIVPIHSTHLQYIEEYLYHSRPYLNTNSNETAFFVSMRGRRMTGDSIAKRIEKLSKEAQFYKSVSLHTLRHSIATHLLENGMKLELISRFLGHSSLESTQVYTHLLEREED